MEALMTNLIRLSRQRLKQFMPDKFQDPDDVKPADQLGGGSSDERRKLSLSEIDFDPSYLLSLLLQQLKIPFIRVRLAIHDFDMQVVSDKGDVISTVPCSYEDDCAILDCIDNRQIPECVQDLLLHPQARKIFWNGLVFVEICHKPMETEKGMVCFKVTTVLKCSTNMLMCYAENALSFADQSKDEDPKCELKNEEKILMALYPDLDLEVPDASKGDQNPDFQSKSKYHRVQLCKPKWKSRFRSANKSQTLHIVEKLRKKYSVQNRFKHFSSTQLRKTEIRSLLSEPYCKAPEQCADILSKKWKDVQALYRLKNPESSNTGCSESDQNDVFPVDHIPKPQTKSPGFCVVPEEKHMIEALASSHCAEIVVSRRSADNFYFGQLKVMSRQRVTNESLKGTTSATVASSPTRGDASNSAANERLCEFELGSRQSVNKYIVEYLRMIADRDRTPKHSITNLRK